ncbi:MAG: hypothetical protein ACTSWN_02675 [Promethearchaeota archaeon]
MNRRPPQSPFRSRARNIKHGIGDSKKVKVATDPERQKKLQKVLNDLMKVMADVEKRLNNGDYKKAYRIASSIIRKYTVETITGNEILFRLSSMAFTAIEYLDVLDLVEKDQFLEFLAKELEQYRKLDLYEKIERIFIRRLEDRLRHIREKGNESLARSWLETWSPWVELIDGEKKLDQFLDGEKINLRWTVKKPIKFSPGEKQSCQSKRKEIVGLLEKNLTGRWVIEVGTAKTGGDTSKAVIDDDLSTVLASASQPPIPVIKKSSSSGSFSKKKLMTQKEKKPAPVKNKAKNHKIRPARIKRVEMKDERLKSSMVKEYLYKLKYELGINEVHYQKIKNDLDVISLNKARKLFRILENFVEKGIVLRKRGSIYAILI